MGLDFEMAINEHYSEVMDVINKLFVYIFDGLNSKHSKSTFPGVACVLAMLLSFCHCTCTACQELYIYSWVLPSILYMLIWPWHHYAVC